MKGTGTKSYTIILQATNLRSLEDSGLSEMVRKCFWVALARGPVQYVVRSIPMFESRLLRIGPIQARCKCSDILQIALESKEGW